MLTTEEITTDVSSLCSNCRRAFTLSDMFNAGEPGVELDKAKAMLLDSDAIIYLGTDECSGDEYFVSKRVLCRWYGYLNVRLALSGTFILSSSVVAKSMSGLRETGQWVEIPPEALEDGYDFGLIAPSPTEDDFLFPLAKALSFVRHELLERVPSLVEQLVDEQRRQDYLHDDTALEILDLSIPSEHRLWLGRERVS